MDLAPRKMGRRGDADGDAHVVPIRANATAIELLHTARGTRQDVAWLQKNASSGTGAEKNTLASTEALVEKNAPEGIDISKLLAGNLSRKHRAHAHFK